MSDMIRSRAQAILPELTAIRRDLHRYAEPGWLEMRTTSLLARKLTDLGYEVLTGPAVCKADARMGLPSDDVLEAHYKWAQENGADPEFLPATRGGFTGVIATMHCGEGPTIALRFDIDALGVLEADDETHLPAREGFRSVTPGIMHACGHDGHAAIGIGTAMLLRELRDQLHGTVRLIFQPAEEGVRGASSIVAAGHLDDADYALAAHVFPAGKAAGLVDVGVLAENGTGGLATSKLDVTFHGRSAHAGIAPQEGRNALLAAATAVLNLHAIPRYGNTPTQLNVGTLRAGTGRNVICETAKLELEVRGQTTEANDYMLRRAQQIVKAAAEMQDCTVELQPMGHADALRLAALVARRARLQGGARPPRHARERARRRQRGFLLHEPARAAAGRSGRVCRSALRLPGGQPQRPFRFRRTGACERRGHVYRRHRFPARLTPNKRRRGGAAPVFSGGYHV